MFIIPWQNNSINAKASKARIQIEEFIGIYPIENIFLCTFQEICDAVKKELILKGFSLEKLNFIQQNLFPLLCAKYFSQSHEIWLVEEIGEKYETIIHELLHSIQVCIGHRENICDYLTYKLTNDSTAIESQKLKEWEKIEQSHGIVKIKKRFLKEGDCEDL